MHAREELGVDPDSLGAPLGAAASSFGAFAVGAVIPRSPWFFASGTAASITSLVLAVVAAAVLGGLLAGYTTRSIVRSAVRQVLIAAGAAGVTYVVGALVGVNVT